MFLHLKKELSLQNVAGTQSVEEIVKFLMLVLMMIYSDYLFHLLYRNIAHQVIDG